MISYLHFVYIDEFHKEDLGYGFDENLNKIIIFIVSAIGGSAILCWTLWYHLQLLWIRVQYYILVLWDKLNGKKGD